MHYSALFLSSVALTMVEAAALPKGDLSSQPKDKDLRHISDRQAEVSAACSDSAASLYEDPGTVTETATAVELLVTVCGPPRTSISRALTTTDIVETKAVAQTSAVGAADEGPTIIAPANIRIISTVLPTIVYNPFYTVSVDTVTTDHGTVFELPPLESATPQTGGIFNSHLGEFGQPTLVATPTAPIPTLESLPPLPPQSQTSVEFENLPDPGQTASALGNSASACRPVNNTASQPAPSGVGNSTVSGASFPYDNSTLPTANHCEPGAGTSEIPALETQSTSSDNSSSSTDMAQGDIFNKPIDTKSLPSQFSSRPDHPVPRTGIETKGPLQTNKFFSNLFLGNQRDPVYTFPYSLTWVDGTGASGSFGMAISHIEEKERQYGPPQFNVQASYYLNPIGIQPMIISAKELSNGTKLTIDSMTAFAARASLSSDKSSEPVVSFPLVQGMAFITAEYNGGTPMIQSSIFFRNMTRTTQQPKKDVTRYTFYVEDGTVWRVYGYKTKGDDLDLQVLNNGVAMATKPFHGVVQIAKETQNNDFLDKGAGIYPVDVKLSGSASGSTGTYEFDFQKKGHPDGELIMFALPHHTQSFDKATTALRGRDTGTTGNLSTSLITTTKGEAVLVQGTKWKMVETSMPIKLGFEPYAVGKGGMAKLSSSAKATIQAAASKEVLQNMTAATDLNSMYWSGKALAKYAFMLYVINDMLGDTKTAQQGLAELKQAFARFADNKQQYPLVHETAWGGVVSTGAYVTGQALEDYGNTYYNDHHFHYGYHILAAAVIGHLDKSWIAANRDYVNMLVRDTSNPSADDKIFPMWRSFDWYHGHSWATGLFASMDGKNQESTSEDMMHAYGLKMWGHVGGDAALEARYVHEASHRMSETNEN